MFERRVPTREKGVSGRALPQTFYFITMIKLVGGFFLLFREKFY